MRIGREAMSSPESVLLPPAEPGAQGEVLVPFVAPMAAGSCTSTWQPATADGTRFGDPVWLMVFVAGEDDYLPHVQAAPRPAQAPAPAHDAGLAGTVATTLPVQNCLPLRSWGWMRTHPSTRPACCGATGDAPGAGGGHGRGLGAHQLYPGPAVEPSARLQAAAGTYLGLKPTALSSTTSAAANCVSTPW